MDRVTQILAKTLDVLLVLVVMGMISALVYALYMLDMALTVVYLK